MDLDQEKLLDLARLTQAATGAQAVRFGNLTPADLTDPSCFTAPAGAAGSLIARFTPGTGLTQAQRELLDSAAREAAKQDAQRGVHLQMALASAQVGLWEWNLPEGKITADQQCENLIGFSAADLRSSLELCRQLLHPDDRERVIPEMLRHFRGSGSEMEFEVRVITRGESYRWIASRARVAERDAGGRAVRVIGTSMDVHDRHAALDQAASADSNLRDLIATSPATLVTVNDALRVTYMTRPWPAGSGKRRLGDSILALVKRDAKKQLEHTLRQVLADGAVRTMEVEVPARAGRRNWYAATIAPLPVGGVTKGAVLSILDITDQRTAEEEARLLRERFEMAVRGSTASLWDYDLRTREEVYSPRFYEMLEMPQDDAARSVDFWESRIHPEDRAYVLGAFRRHLHEGAVYDVEYRMQTSKGHYRWFNTRGQALRDSNGVAYRMAGSTVDITERKLAEEAVRLSEERYRLLFYASPQPMFVFDPTTQRLLAMNDAACALYGATRRDLRQDPNWVAEHRGQGRQRRHDGQVLEVEYKEHEIEFADQPALLALVTDRTRQVQLEKQLLQSQKMDAFGQLAGGVAHDFNNLLTVINGYGKLGLRKLDANAPARRDLELVLSAGERAMGLTRQLLAFARRQVIQPQQVSLQHLLERSITILRPLLGERIRLTLECPPDLGTVRADPGQLEQVLINLAVNARDAMPGGGNLSIRASAIQREENAVEYPPEMHPGPYARIEVKDSGKGMTRDELQHIFEPFFTTKPVGKGTGLGLSTVYGVVTQADGYIAVDSEPGHGATFSIYLPSTGTTPLPPTEPEREVRLPAPAGRETILLVEDEEGVRGFAKLVLEASGYTVLQARDGVEALDIYRAEKDRIGLILTDLVMPRMTGFELAKQLRALTPSVPLAFMSGYPDDAAEVSTLPGPVVSMLQKPFQEDTLRTRVRQVLDENSRPG